MYGIAANAIPTPTATVRSAIAVSKNVTAQTAISAFISRRTGGAEWAKQLHEPNLGRVVLHAILAIVFHRIHRAICLSNQTGSVASAFGIQTDTDAGSNRN